ncbi:hypothetical protein GCM10020260_02450 [Nesterenkonia halobia]|uniref:Uncharacterized protein n=1 Tax=Nesterenkonia halobia TaxID=37922 RepID=A0ABP6R8S3_9MICC
MTEVTDRLPCGSRGARAVRTGSVATLHDFVNPLVAADEAGYANDSWAGEAIGWYGGEP